ASRLRGCGFALRDVPALRALHVALGLVGHERAARRARIRRGALPHGEVAVRVPVAAVERLAAACALDDEVTFAALRTGDARLLLFLLDVLAVGVAAAAHERAEPADALQERLAALRTHLAGLLRLGPRLAGHVAGVGAIRIVLAPDELPAATELHDERAGLATLLRAERTELVELLLRPLDLVLLLLEEPVERSVELVEHLGPRHL